MRHNNALRTLTSVNSPQSAVETCRESLECFDLNKLSVDLDFKI